MLIAIYCVGWRQAHIDQPLRVQPQLSESFWPGFSSGSKGAFIRISSNISRGYH